MSQQTLPLSARLDKRSAPVPTKIAVASPTPETDGFSRHSPVWRIVIPAMVAVGSFVAVASQLKFTEVALVAGAMAMAVLTPISVFVFWACSTTVGPNQCLIDAEGRVIADFSNRAIILKSLGKYLTEHGAWLGNYSEKQRVISFTLRRSPGEGRASQQSGQTLELHVSYTEMGSLGDLIASMHSLGGCLPDQLVLEGHLKRILTKFARGTEPDALLATQDHFRKQTVRATGAELRKYGLRITDVRLTLQ